MPIKLMTHAVIGYPSLNDTAKLVKSMVQAGVEQIELQIPFSDPVADGPVITEANDSALAQGVTLAQCLELASKLSQQVNIPLYFMGYYHTVFTHGVDIFCAAAAKAGVRGLIIPDVPFDEEVHEHFMTACKRHGLSHIRVLSPNMSQERLRANLKLAQDFVYCTSRLGITGVHNHTLHPQLETFLQQVKKQTSVPLAVGFGISRAEHVRALQGKADIAVVGSAVIEQIKQQGIQSVPSFIRSITGQNFNKLKTGLR